MDPEYAVLNRASRRIWAVAMRDLYGASERSQKFKLHVQTSGRSLHAQEISFNDIRTTLQALTALYDNCNSLHTNSYDEAITTPTDESVRRAVAIQMIIDKEYGLYKNENMLQGSFIIEELTELVEEAILCEFESLSERGGVLGAMERGYQRGKIQEESHYYESLKSSGEYPIIGVNTFRNPEADHDAEMDRRELRRGTDEEKQGQLRRLREFQERHQAEAPAALKKLTDAALTGGNTFDALMEAVRVCSMGQITQRLFAVGGEYRRNT
jgi:methylmalonyl-CoA mutase